MVRTNQGGSILGFLIIGGVMALLLIGGVYLVRKNLIPAMGPGTVAVKDDEDKAPSSEEDRDTPEAEEAKPSDDETASENLPGPLKVADKPQPKDDNDSQRNLPETGPGGILLSGFLLSGIVAASLAYFRSRGQSVSL